MKSIIVKFFFLFAFLLSMSQSIFAENKPDFNKVVFFGDSLTDNGNFYSHSAHLLPKYPPYYNGRFSNGYNWADLVSNELFSKFNISSENYAVGGATAYFHNPLDGYLPVTLAMEKDDYNIRYMLSDKSNTLYVIWIGANDYLPGNLNVDDATTNVVNAITSTIQSLVSNKGAEFFIVSIPDLSLTPQAAMNHFGDNYKDLVTMHNQKLHAAIVNLQSQYPHTKFIEFNFSDHPILNEVVTSAAYREAINKKYGVNITNVTDACWTGGFTHPTQQSIQQNLMQSLAAQKNESAVDTDKLAKEIVNNPSLLEVYRVQQMAVQDNQRCADADQYLFWDHMHPTAATHKVLAGILSDALFGNG